MRDHDQTVTRMDDSRPRRAGDGSVQAGDTLGGRFVLRTLLGSGASGRVFAAMDTKVGHRVAVKVLHPDLRDAKTRERLRREVRTSRSGHPSIVSVYDLHETDGQLYLSMEWVEGQSQRDSLKDAGPMSAERVIEIGRQVASALEHLHGLGLIHRDVKPGNILLGDDQAVKLCDMGLARPLEEGVTVTETEMVVGTPDYMAPEQALGTELSGASDVYGLGLTLYQALTGKIPLRESTAIATLTRRQKERPPSVRKESPDCPRWLNRLIRRMLEPEPQERLTAAGVRKVLDAERLMPRLRQKTLFTATAVLLLVAVAVTGAGLLIRRPTVAVDVGETFIAGRDAEGSETWRRDFEIPVRQQIRGDLDGDGVEEVGLVISESVQSGSRTGPLKGPEVWLFDRGGRVLTKFLPEESIWWNFDYGKELRAFLHFIDVDHDGLVEPLLVAQHMTFFPSAVFRYVAAPGAWQQVLLVSGRVRGVYPTPVDAGPGFRFLGPNNLMGVVEFLGEIAIEGESIQQSWVAVVAESIRFGGLAMGQSGDTRKIRWRSYLPLGDGRGGHVSEESGLIDGPDGGIELTMKDGQVLRYDSMGNPLDSPNLGRDLSELRLDFMRSLAQWTANEQDSDPSVVRRMFGESRGRFEPILREPAYRLIFDLAGAAALARSGELEEAIRILISAAEETRSSDAQYRLAHLQALAGRFKEAEETLRRLIVDPEFRSQGTRSSFDGPHLLVRVGIEDRDAEVIEEVVGHRLGNTGRQNEVAVQSWRTLEARMHLWWDEVQPEDFNVGSFDLAPAGEAIACLARWRMGQSDAGDIAEMEAFIERNPDAAWEGRLALAASLVATGRSSEAIVQLDLMDKKNEFPAGADFSLHQVLDLARALRIIALEADGQVERARTEGAELLPELTPNLLPAILVTEVLRRSL
ncbi:MAG: protein kinase [Acidobacteriota bacterium]